MMRRRLVSTAQRCSAPCLAADPLAACQRMVSMFGKPQATPSSRLQRASGFAGEGAPFGSRLYERQPRDGHHHDDSQNVPGGRWRGFQPKRDSRQRERENAWRAFSEAMRDVRRIAGRTPHAGESANESVASVDRAHTTGNVARVRDEHAELACQVSRVEATSASDRRLLESLGVTDLDETLDAADGRMGASRDEVAAAKNEDDANAAAIDGTAAMAPMIPCFTARQTRELRLHVARACRNATQAGVAPILVMERILSSIAISDGKESDPGLSPTLKQDSTTFLEDLLLPVMAVPPRSAESMREVERRGRDAGRLESWRTALALFDEQSVVLLLRAQATRLKTHVQWSQQRLRDSRSPAAAAPLRVGGSTPKSATPITAANAAGTTAAVDVAKADSGDCLYSQCGDAAVLQWQLMVEHRHAEQLLSFFEPRITREVRSSDDTRALGSALSGAASSPSHLVSLPTLRTLEAGLSLCAALQGGQGAARAHNWSVAALSFAESLLSRQNSNPTGGDDEKAGEEARIDAGRLLEVIRGPLVRCCTLALDAAATGEASGVTGAFSPSSAFSSPSSQTQVSISFECCYGLVVRLVSLLQRASDAALAQEESSFSTDYTEGGQTITDDNAVTAFQNHRNGSFKKTFAAFADTTLLLLPSLADVLTARGHTRHLESLCSMLTTMLTETDVGYELSTAPQVRRCLCAVLKAIAATRMDATTASEMSEQLWWAVVNHARPETWEHEEVTLQLLAVQAAAASRTSATPSVRFTAGAAETLNEASVSNAAHSAPLESRALVLFNRLMEPRTRTLGQRECALGSAILTAPITHADRDVQRLLSFATQRFPISMDTAHALAAKLLLRDALLSQETVTRMETRRRDAPLLQAFASRLSCAAVYLVLDTAIACQRHGRDGRAERTFLLRLLTLRSDVELRLHNGASASISDAHLADVLETWLHELTSACGVKTVGSTTVQLMYEVMQSAALTAADCPRASAVLKAAVETFSRRLVEGAPESTTGMEEVYASSTQRIPTERSYALARLVTHIGEPSAYQMLVFPPHFSAAHCTSPSSPWTVSDAHAFLEDVQHLLRETQASTQARAALTLRDYAALCKLDTYVHRHGRPRVLWSQSAPLPVLSPLCPLEGLGTRSVEVELGVRLPHVASLSPVQMNCTAPAAVRWLAVIAQEEGGEEGHPLVGGAHVGLSREALFPLQLRSLLENYADARQRQRTQQSLEADDASVDVHDKREASLEKQDAKPREVDAGNGSEVVPRTRVQRRRAPFLEAVMFELPAKSPTRVEG